MAKFAQFKVGDPVTHRYEFVQFTPSLSDPTRKSYNGTICYYRNGSWYVPYGKGGPRDSTSSPVWGMPLPVAGQTPNHPGMINTSDESGQKFDGDKDEPGLLLSGCHLAVAGVIAVLGFGFRKYKQRNGWKEVPEAKRRYKDALHRHLQAIERGELIDPESGKPHIDHVACNAMFLSQMHHEGFGE